ncbi:hypothetical protein VINI7043_17649 [Vibrio nigripulchritudo ATCC 27043]|nr:hypothetical protein VINI7043_17649 [Vibrio nigripulchritudo ATCC 27043]
MTHKEKDQINWDDKAKELEFILERFKKNIVGMTVLSLLLVMLKIIIP